MPITLVPTEPFDRWECSTDMVNIEVWREREGGAFTEKYGAIFSPNQDLLYPRRWYCKVGFPSHRAAVQWVLALYVELASNEAAAAAQLARSYAEGVLSADNNTH